ncbi:MAG: hypothetical protein ACK504_06800 [Bacteroidota bacterium]
MKQIIYIATIFTLLTFFACKKVKNEAMTVIRDCTGTYLRFKGKDYHVCNLEKVSSFEDGTEVTATFKKIKECSSISGGYCLKFHENEGWINVEKVK